MATPEEIRQIALNAASAYSLPPDLFLRLIQRESSSGQHNLSPKGARGPAQLMPGTFADLSPDGNIDDPEQNIDAGARYLKQQLDAFGGDPALALAAYNAGPGAVRQYGGIPPYSETQNYVSAILGSADSLGTSVIPDSVLSAIAPSILYSKPEWLLQMEGAQEEAPSGPVPLTDDVLASLSPNLLTETPGPEHGWGDLGVDILADQMEPLNLAALMLGSPLAKGLVKGLGASAVIAEGTRTAGKAVGALTTSQKLLNRALHGLGYTLPFAAVELVEPPEDDSSRLKEFGTGLFLMEALDVALIGGGLAWRGLTSRTTIGAARSLKEARSITKSAYNSYYEAALSSGKAPAEASSLAFADLIDSKLTAMNEALGPANTARFAETLQTLAAAPPSDMLDLSRGMMETMLSSPDFRERTLASGISPQAFQGGINKLFSEMETSVAASAAETTTRLAAEKAAERAALAARVRLVPSSGGHQIQFLSEFTGKGGKQFKAWRTLIAPGEKLGVIRAPGYAPPSRYTAAALESLGEDGAAMVESIAAEMKSARVRELMDANPTWDLNQLEAALSGRPVKTAKMKPFVTPKQRKANLEAELKTMRPLHPESELAALAGNAPPTSPEYTILDHLTRSMPDPAPDADILAYLGQITSQPFRYPNVVATLTPIYNDLKRWASLYNAGRLTRADLDHLRQAQTAVGVVLKRAEASAPKKEIPLVQLRPPTPKPKPKPPAKKSGKKSPPPPSPPERTPRRKY